MNEYWAQWDRSEIAAMHGYLQYDPDLHHEEDIIRFDGDDEDDEEECSHCPGCSSCLMVA